MRIVAALLLWLLFGCTRLPPEPRSVVVDSDTKAQCARSCSTLRQVGCPEGNPSPGGTSCEAVCADAHDLLPVA